jgi:N-acetylglucosamine malate deacetylase 1
MKENTKTVLVLSPHSDDMEISCGGTVARFIDEGYEVYSIVFSYAEESIPEEFKRYATVLEYKKSTELLGVKCLSPNGFGVRTFTSYRQRILDIMIKAKAGVNPDIVLLPNSNDIHQDHQVIHQEGIRAFKHSTILGYDNIWNSMGKSNMTTYISLTEEHLNKKVNAIKCYESQLYKNPDLIIDVIQLANIRGSEIGKKHAEIFENIRSII